MKPLPTAVVDAGLAASYSDARRKIVQGGILVDGLLVEDIGAEVPARAVVTIRTRPKTART